MVKEQQVSELIEQCSKAINNGNTDSFASYEEGVKDALIWAFYGGDKPFISTDEEEEETDN